MKLHKICKVKNKLHRSFSAPFKTTYRRTCRTIKHVSVEAENKAVSGEEELIQEKNPPEIKAKDTAEVEKKIKVDEEDEDSNKDTVKKEVQAEAPEEKNEADSGKTQTEKSEAKSTQDKAEADSKPESTDESEEVNKTKS